MQSSETESGLLPRGARAALLVAGLALVVLAAVQAWQVIARYVLNDSPGWTEPLALLLLNTAMSLGAAAAVQQRAHFGFPLLVHLAPPRLRRLLEAFSSLVVLGLGGVLAIGGIRLLLDGWGVRMAGTVLPQGLMFLPLSLGGALMVCFAGAELFAPRRAAAEPR
ncbi:TRAP transporter small permease [Tahibacter caeni]|uniref:TRAP transporter small permease n=1 Tax=Tahibacter caeni TaxID=1453545 RepID=UPI002148DD8D|nr:TRAP transporter small permease [Tahibacter caeni]